MKKQSVVAATVILSTILISSVFGSENKRAGKKDARNKMTLQQKFYQNYDKVKHWLNIENDEMAIVEEDLMFNPKTGLKGSRKAKRLNLDQNLIMPIGPRPIVAPAEVQSIPGPGKKAKKLPGQKPKTGPISKRYQSTAK